MKKILAFAILTLWVPVSAAAPERAPQVLSLAGPVRLGLPPGSVVDVPEHLYEGKPFLLLVVPIPFEKCPPSIPEYGAEARTFHQEVKMKRRDPRACLRHAALAQYWSRRFKQIAVRVLDPRSSDETALQRMKVVDLDSRLLIRDPDKGTLAERLHINRSPAAFLLDKGGRIIDKRLGFGLGLWPGFEAQLLRIERGERDEFSRNTMHELVEGQRVEYWPPSALRGEYTFVIHMLPGCPPCVDLGAQIADLSRKFLNTHTNVKINIFIPDLTDEEATCERIKEWTERIGWAHSPATICPAEGSLSESRNLVKGELPEGVRLVVYTPGDPDDVQQRWGIIHGPSYALIHGDRVVLRYPYTPLLPHTRAAGQVRSYEQLFIKLADYLNQ